MQLTYKQYLIEKNQEKTIRTSSSDDDTKISFVNKKLDDLVKEIRNTFTLYGNVMLQQKENGTYYVDYFGRPLWLKEKVFK
ncbi:hypothetical protein P5757_15250 [Bacillus tropicus]|uniref:hypothetical protein n=1 Tax=Bacillus tropicus TaxID=2026188 RepID=UPI000AB5E0D5|nr:hypothetical protein [Bacillus tropicus]MDF9557925.1 hypothetical protein [Bacillus tropicus]MDF9590132.1 hypothetical protein [Bacillus tropicus]MDF9648844.1 hypothetical protein [Bacillus tropicus]